VGAAAGALRAQADTIFRTVTTAAYSEGRKSMADDPAVRAVVSGWRYDATLDSDVRPNHRAADNFSATLDDPVWRTLTPPLGFNCRCALSIVTPDEARAAGIVDRRGNPIYQSVPPGAGPDPGFRAG
jgi:SPP1 gp7 family putative phage head morphogenesis protein